MKWAKLWIIGVRRRRLRPILLAAIVAFTVVEIVALSPASVEEGGDQTAAVEPEMLLPKQETTLASGIPHDKIPDYSVDQFNYVSTQGSEKQWKLIATRAYLYNQIKLVHSRQVRAFLYDPEGKVTLITGKESKYFMNQKDLEVFGDVETTFPDGFKLKSEYLRYHPDSRKIEIPTQYAVHGDGQEKDGQRIIFDSHGMNFAMAQSEIILPKAVKLTMVEEKLDARGKKQSTTIISDHCLIKRGQQIAHFTMDPKRPFKERFVHITQPTLFSRARRADLNYGDFSKILQYLVAYEDVLIKETGDGTSLKYATGGRADFDTNRDVIVLREFPQAYQDNDTVTGDVILLHRDTDIVEVEHSNAFSDGTN